MPPERMPAAPRGPLAEWVEPVREWAAQTAQTLRSYRLVDLRGDALAGLTVAVVAIPQCLAYALIAEVPPEYGLYTLILQCLIGAALNSHPLLSVGPINTQSLLVASITTRLADPGDVSTYVALVIMLTLAKGLIQVALATMHLGGLTRYVSQSVLVGFTAGAGVLIAAGQLPAFLGMSLGPRADTWPGLIGLAQRLQWQLGTVQLWTLLIGLLALGVVLGARRIHRLVPGPLLAVILGGVIAAMLPTTIATLPMLPDGLPAPRWPWQNLSLPTVESLLPGAMALALLGLMEAYAIGKALPGPARGGVSANRELFSQGLTNAASSFVGCIPGSGSFSRSALNAYAGARTFVSSWINAGAVLIVLLLFSDWARYIPMAAIAAVLFVIAYSLVDWRYLLRTVRASRSDAYVCGVTFLATLCIPLVYAVFLGITLNIALYLRRARQLYVTEMVANPDESMGASPFIERPLREHPDRRDVMFLQIEGNLFFAAADELRDRLHALCDSGVKVVILRLKRSHMLDATVMQVIEQSARELQDAQGALILTGLRPRMLQRMREFGLVDCLGEENVFATEDSLFSAARKAVARAKALTGHEPANRPVDYQI